MSKKQTRRAAREAFPKAKSGSAKKGAGSGQTRQSGGPKPPTWRGAVMWSAAFTVIFLVIFRYVMKSSMPTTTYVIWGVVWFVIYVPFMYYTNQWQYKKRVQAAERAKLTGQQQKGKGPQKGKK